MQLRPYEHQIQYYETDQMKVVHHSNYIRWFEEARTDLMRQIGLPYEELEKKGILCPVLEASAKYLRMLRFGDTAIVNLTIKEYNGIKLVISYQVLNKKTNMIHCKGETSHCFLTELGKPVSLKKNYPVYHEKFLACMAGEETKEQGKLETERDKAEQSETKQAPESDDKKEKVEE